jgi:hypothetical protein
VKNPDKVLRELAYRARSGMIGELESCTCSFPLEHFETSSGHHERCAAHGCHLSSVEVATRDPGKLLVVQPQPFPMWATVGGWTARCRTCGAEPFACSISQLAALMVVEHGHALPAGGGS